jgi:hypothetical protein
MHATLAAARAAMSAIPPKAPAAKRGAANADALYSGDPRPFSAPQSASALDGWMGARVPRGLHIPGGAWAWLGRCAWLAGAATALLSVGRSLQAGHGGGEGEGEGGTELTGTTSGFPRR